MGEPIDLGAELADYTDAEHAPAHRPAPSIGGGLGEQPAGFRPLGYIDQVQGLKITAPAGPPPAWPLTADPQGGGRCAQCQRWIPLPDGLFVAADCLYCDECADARRRTNGGRRIEQDGDYPSQCEQCGNTHPARLTSSSGVDRRWLCDQCRDKAASHIHHLDPSGRCDAPDCPMAPPF